MYRFRSLIIFIMMFKPSLIFIFSSSASAAAAGPRYTVRHFTGHDGRSVIVDSSGREVVFRGVNIGAEKWRNDHRPWDPELYENGLCPTAETSYNQPPVCGVDYGKGKWDQNTEYDSRNDLAQIRAAGFNLVRLAISWSLLEPKPLEYSEKYLERIGQIVKWAAEQDVEVIIDMHQDNYGTCVGNDGAPSWACLNLDVDHVPWWAQKIYEKVQKQIPFQEGVLLAFDSFYRNNPVPDTGKGLQEHFILAWSQILKKFDGAPNVIGYEILNEPAPGLLSTLISTEDYPLIGFSTKYLFPLYKAWIQAMTGVRDGLLPCEADDPISAHCAHPDLGHQTKKLVLFEPMALRNQLDFSLQVSKPFTEYPNMVFAPHVYTHFFTFPHWPPVYFLALDSAWAEAKGLQASVLVTEYGGDSHEDEKVSSLTNELDEHYGTSGTVWTWKENGGWGLFEPKADKYSPNGPLMRNRQKINMRVYARAVAGSIVQHHFKYETGSFQLLVDCCSANGDTPYVKDSPTEIYVPEHIITRASKMHVKVDGVAALAEVKAQPDNSKIVRVMPTEPQGLYAVQLTFEYGENEMEVEVATEYEARIEHNYFHVEDRPQFNGLSYETLGMVGKAAWPLYNGTDPDMVVINLARALARAAQEAYGHPEEGTPQDLEDEDVDDDNNMVYA